MKNLKSKFEKHQVKNPFGITGGKSFGFGIAGDNDEDKEPPIVVSTNKGKKNEGE